MLKSKDALSRIPKGATHYHEAMDLYYKFGEAWGMADAYIGGEWRDFPLYPSIRALSDIEKINKLEFMLESGLGYEDLEREI